MESRWDSCSAALKFQTGRSKTVIVVVSSLQLEYKRNVARRKTRIPKWLWVVIIPAISAIFVAIIGIFGHSRSPSQSNIVAGTNLNHSISVAGNQTGNNTIEDRSTKSLQQAVQGLNQGVVYAPQFTTINNFSTNMPPSVTREAFEALEKKLDGATDNIELTRNDVRLLARALKDLDQRTSGIEKLPDGRTKMGRIVSGNPTIVIEALTAGAQSYNKGDYATALASFERGLEAYESRPSDLFYEDITYKPEGIGDGYSMAALSAQRLHSNSIANEFAEKAVKTRPDAQTQLLFSTTLANSANDILNSANPDLTAALSLSRRSIDTFELSEKAEDFTTNLLKGFDIGMLYGIAANSAIRIGSNSLACDFADRGTKASPENPINSIVFAQALYRMGSNDASDAVLDRFVKTFPDARANVKAAMADRLRYLIRVQPQTVR